MAAKSKTNKAGTDKFNVGAYATICCLAVAAFAASKYVNELPPNAPNKPFDTFEEFYPFYLSQHAEQTCCRLHFIGTTIILLLAVMDYRIPLSLFPAALGGLATFAFTKSLPHGIAEAIVMMSTFLMSMKFTKAGVLKGLLLLFIGYGFAWVGHFFFELNRPATFIYPIFSFMGDFRMWYDIASMQKAF